MIRTKIFLIATLMLLAGCIPTTCYDKTCIVSAMDECSRARLTFEESFGTVEYNSYNTCGFDKTIISLKNETPEMKLLLEGKMLYCSFEKGEDNPNWAYSLLEGIEECEGELKAIIGDLIILS